MALTQINNLNSNGGLNRVENVSFGNFYIIGNLDTRRMNVGANIKHVRVQQRVIIELVSLYIVTVWSSHTLCNRLLQE